MPPTALADKFLDAIMRARVSVPSRRTGLISKRLIPEQDRRVLIVLALIIQSHIEESSLPPEAFLHDEHLIKTSELVQWLSPRKDSSSHPFSHTDAIFGPLDWLAAHDLIHLTPVGLRRKAHLVWLTPDDALGEWTE